MAPIEDLKTYITNLKSKLSVGGTTEHTHRAALQILLETLGDTIQAVNEPEHIECGAPDFRVMKGQVPTGYLEAKDIGTNLLAIEKTEQIKRYLHSLNNLILTDYLEFRWYVEGELRETSRLGILTHDGKIKTEVGGFKATSNLLVRFIQQQTPTIKSPEELAKHMAALAAMLRDLMEEAFLKEQASGVLHSQLNAFHETLIPDLDVKQFSDMYAQTITYGLFAARIRLPKGEPFTRQSAAWNLPKTNPFLRQLFNEIAGPDLDERIAWIVDDIAHLLQQSDMEAILKDFGSRTRKEDPVVHFYETFLSAYDPKLRQRRGVYYTPEPVVSFIMRSIDHILKIQFERPDGLADRDTIILDPAVGTATFLYHAVQIIFERLGEIGLSGMWNDYVDSQLLPRIFGFELLMAPYAVAHMKIGMQLQDLGYTFDGDTRLGVYLTNTLAKIIFQEEAAPFARYITEEANAAAEIKEDKPVMVVIGNPPYSVSSANKSEFIEKLMDRYKKSIRNERNIQPLSDDYIKFIRFAHNRINKTGFGVIGMITSHSYLSGLIHRSMREELMKDFDEIYILNLHGNLIVKETTPDGCVDDNVFDIRQGVSIIFLIKFQEYKQDGKSNTTVYYSDLWGIRDEKYKYLLENDILSTQWERLSPSKPYFFFVPKDFSLVNEYEKGFYLPDIFTTDTTGIKTHRDHFAVAFSNGVVRSRIKDLRDKDLSDEDIREKYNLPDTRDWSLSTARKSLFDNDRWETSLVSCLYRPYDIRSIYFSGDVVELPRFQIMRHLLKPNLALVVGRAGHVIQSNMWSLVFCSDKIIDTNIFYRGGGNVFPLYLYPTPEETNGTLFASDEIHRRPNLSQAFLNRA